MFYASDSVVFALVVCVLCHFFVKDVARASSLGGGGHLVGIILWSLLRVKHLDCI